MYLFDYDGSGAAKGRLTLITQHPVDGMDVVEEISSLDIDLLTILARIYQSRELIYSIDILTARMVTCDAPRLASHITDAGIQFSRDTELDTGFTTWLVEIRQTYRESLVNGERL